MCAVIHYNILLFLFSPLILEKKSQDWIHRDEISKGYLHLIRFCRNSDKKVVFVQNRKRLSIPTLLFP